MIVRTLLMAGALAAVALLSVALSGERHLEAARGVLRSTGTGGLPPAEAERALSELKRARERSPGTAALRIAVGVEFARGRTAAAAALAREATREEPEGFEGWALLATTLRAGDPDASRRALERAGRLNPLFLRPRSEPVPPPAGGP